MKIAEINASTAPRTMKKLFVLATPTVIYFKKGQELDRVEGFRGEPYHQDVIDNERLQPADSVANAANVAR